MTNSQVLSMFQAALHHDPESFTITYYYYYCSAQQCFGYLHGVNGAASGSMIAYQPAAHLLERPAHVSCNCQKEPCSV